MDGQLAAGRAQLQAGNAFAAIRAAKRALQEEPQNVEALELLCAAHMQERDYMLAQETLSQWLRISPTDPDAHSTQIMLQMSLGRQNDAKARIEQFSQSFPAHAHHTAWLLAMWEEAFGSAQKAVELYEDLLAEQPDSIALKTRLAMAQVEARNSVAACELMLEVLAEDPNDAEALRTLAVGELKAFKLSSARQLADAALQANPKDKAMPKVKWLSWLILFPPFAVGHFAQLIISRLRYVAGNIASNILCGLIFAAMLGALIYASQLNDVGDQMPMQTSLMFAFGFLAGCWALSMYYIFGIGNADDDQRTASLPGY